MMFRWRFNRDPVWSEFSRLQKGMDELFSALSSRMGTGYVAPFWSGARLFPLLNVKEVADAYIVTAEIPGMKKEDLEIKIEGDTLTLKGERKPYEIGESASYHRRERATGIFQRSLTLSGKLDAENVKATYKDGVLTIVLKKTPAAIPKQISITAE